MSKYDYYDMSMVFKTLAEAETEEKGKNAFGRSIRLSKTTAAERFVKYLGSNTPDKIQFRSHLVYRNFELRPVSADPAAFHFFQNLFGAVHGVEQYSSSHDMQNVRNTVNDFINRCIPLNNSPKINEAMKSLSEDATTGLLSLFLSDPSLKEKLERSLPENSTEFLEAFVTLSSLSSSEPTQHLNLLKKMPPEYLSDALTTLKIILQSKKGSRYLNSRAQLDKILDGIVKVIKTDDSELYLEFLSSMKSAIRIKRSAEGNHQALLEAMNLFFRNSTH